MKVERNIHNVIVTYGSEKLELLRPHLNLEVQQLPPVEDVVSSGVTDTTVSIQGWI